MSEKPKSGNGNGKKKKEVLICLKCGKPGADHFVMTGDHAMKGPYHEGCRPRPASGR